MLGGNKDVVPKTCLEISLQLGNVEVRTSALAYERMHVVIEVKTKVEQRARCHLAIDGDVRFVQMPSTGTDEQDGRFLLGSVDLAILGVGVGDGTPDGISQGCAALR